MSCGSPMKFGGQGYGQFMVSQTPVFDKKRRKRKKKRSKG